ncbi:TPA: CDP-glycerol glycerophosphotransferase family protein, partial [Listeria monocytogenes]
SLWGLFVYNSNVYKLLYEQKEPDILNDSRDLHSICFVSTEVEDKNNNVHFIAESADLLADCLVLLEKENKHYLTFMKENLNTIALAEKIEYAPDIICPNKVLKGSLYTNPECIDNSLAGSTFSKDLLKRVANEMKQEVFELTSFNYYCYHLAEKIGHLGEEASYSLSLADLDDSV